MNKFAVTVLTPLLLVFGATNCSAGQNPESAAKTDKAAAPAAAADIPAGARAIIESYPDFFGENAWQKGTLVWKDGTKTVYDDGREKSHQQLLDEADPEDMFHFVYDAGLSPDIPYLHDPGRSRNDAMFMKMYGNSAAAVQRNLVTVKWFGQNLRVPSVNGVDKALRAVADELAKHQILSDLKIPVFWILHDKDTIIDKKTGETIPKKPHYHVMLMFDNPRFESTAQDICIQCGGNGHLEELISRKGYARYLTHIDEPEKYQYSSKDVVCLGGADYNASSMTVTDIKNVEDDILVDVIDYCKSKNIIAYCKLIDYCIENKREWLSFLRSPNGRIVRDYIKSYYWYNH